MTTPASGVWIRLASDEFGEERFDYATLADARAAFDQLCREAEIHTATDGISRDIDLIIATARTSDHIAARLLIGGSIPVSLVPDLTAAITAEHAFLDYGEAPYAPTGHMDLLYAVRDGHLILIDPEAAWGECADLERFLRTHAIAFDRYTQAKYEYGAEVVKFRPGMTARRTFLATQDGDILVPPEDVTTALRDLERGRIEAAIARLTHAIGEDIPVLERLSFVDPMS